MPEWIFVFVEVIQYPNVACFVLCGTLDDGRQLLSEYNDIREVYGWHHEEFFNS